MYKNQINNLIDTQDWNGLVKYTNELRKQNSSELVFGLKTNFFNVIQTSNSSIQDAINFLKKMGFYIISGTGPEILDKIKHNEIKIEDAGIKNIGIVTKSTSLAGELSLLNFPVSIYKFYSIIDYDDPNYMYLEDGKGGLQYHFTNLETNKLYSFEEAQLSGIIRDERINSILD
jgi:hypothetical protein